MSESEEDFLSSSDIAFDDESNSLELDDSASDVSMDHADINFDSQFSNKQEELKSYEVDYKVLTPSMLMTQQAEVVNDVADLTAMKPELAAVLLRHWEWNRDKMIERYMEDSEKCVAEAGIDIEKRPRQKKRPRGFVCEVCYDEESSNDTVALSCNHRFCKDCYTTYIETKIVSEGESRKIQCMETKCTLVVDEATIQSLVSAETMERYHRLLSRTYVDDNPRLRWCPAAGCENAVQCNISSKSLVRIVPTVECTCGKRFCFGCGHDDHQPTICPLVDRWLKKCQDDSETANWISANTQDCPKCNSTIEKNGGCNHMTCKHCRHEFCWICLGLWSDHQQQFYNCSRYKEDKSFQQEIKGKESKQNQSRKTLERYLFYYNRYANHEQSARLERELYMRIEKKMEEIQASSNLTWVEVQFMKRAVETLSSCRRTLKWTYAMAYYLARDNETYIFEDNQNDLEQKVESLSELLEKPLDESTITDLRQDVTNRTVYLSKRHEVLLEYITDGHSEERWSYNIDINI